MKERTLTPNEVRRIGMDALRQALGPVGMIRFLQQFEAGRGDYTRQHEKAEDHDTVQTLAMKLQRWHKGRARPGTSLPPKPASRRSHPKRSTIGVTRSGR